MHRLPYSNIVEKTVTNYIAENENKQLDGFVLYQNYPNPFNPITTIRYQIPEVSFVTLKVYDVIGNEIATLVANEKLAGEYSVDFNASSFPSGMYIYKLQAGSIYISKKMILLK